jgi:hypothetical protein
MNATLLTVRNIKEQQEFAGRRKVASIENFGP